MARKARWSMGGRFLNLSIILLLVLSIIQFGEEAVEFTGTANAETNDNIAPTSNINDPDGISGTASDTGGSGLKVVQVCIEAWFDNDPYWDGNKWVYTSTPIWLNATGTSNWSYSGVNWQNNGYYTVYSRAIDNANNTQKTPSQASFSICYDTKNPTIGLYTKFDDGIWLKGIHELKGYAFDTGECNAYVSKVNADISLGNYSWSYTQSRNYWDYEDWEFSLRDITWPSNIEAQAYITCTAYDAHSNSGTVTEQFGYDTLAPKSKINFPQKNSILSDIDEITGTAYDGGSGVEGTWISIKRHTDNKYWDGSNSKWVDTESWWWAKGEENWIFNTSKIDWIKSKYTIRSKTHDNAYQLYADNSLSASWNWEIPTEGIIIQIGDAIPIFNTAINGGLNYTNSKFLTVGIDTDCNITTFDKISYSTDNVTWSPWQNFTNEIKLESNQNDGEVTIFIRVMNNLKNIGYANDTIIIDTTPPVEFKPKTNSTGWINVSSIQISFSTTDAGSGVRLYQLSIDDGVFIDAESPFSIQKLGDGTHNITVRAFDRAGNYIDGSTGLKIDATPPEHLSVSIISCDTFATLTTLEMTMEASDTTSGVDTMSFSFDGTTWGDWEDFKDYKKFQLIRINDEVTIHFRVIDNAGNIAGPTTKIIYPDTNGIESMNYEIEFDLAGEECNGNFIENPATDAGNLGEIYLQAKSYQVPEPESGTMNVKNTYDINNYENESNLLDESENRLKDRQSHDRKILPESEPDGKRFTDDDEINIIPGSIEVTDCDTQFFDTDSEAVTLNTGKDKSKSDGLKPVSRFNSSGAVWGIIVFAALLIMIILHFYYIGRIERRLNTALDKDTGQRKVARAYKVVAKRKFKRR